MNFLDKKVLERIWWYGLNIITTLFIISLISVNGPKGDSGLPGEDGVDGAGALTTYPVNTISYDAAPVGTARAAYAQSLVQKGYTPLATAEDFAIFSESPFLEDFPYAIGNPEAFDNKKYVLTADIDFSDIDTTSYQNIIPGFIRENDSGSYQAYFSGIFDGAGYSIQGFSFITGEYSYSAGFFPYTDDAIIKNLNFVDSEVSVLASSGGYGTVVGTASSTTLLQNITVTNSDVFATDPVGGLVGRAEGNLYLLNVDMVGGLVYGNNVGGLIGYVQNRAKVFIQDSLNSATIDESLVDEDAANYIYADDVGGLIGYVDESDSIIILNSANHGDIFGIDGEGSGEAGGLIGYIDASYLTVIANSYNSGRVESEGAEVGGLIGDVDSEYPTYIQNSFNAGPLYVTEYAVGGLIGEIGFEFEEEDDEKFNASPVYITNSYNSGSISSSEYDDEKGGLIGEITSTRRTVITNSFNVGTFSVSIATYDFGNVFPQNGAIVGDTGGVTTLDNVAYYVNESQLDAYLEHALDIDFAPGATKITNRDAFTQEDFIYDNVWNFSSIWTFGTGGYEFPILRNLPTFTQLDVKTYAPEIFYTDFWDYDVYFDEELLENVFVFPYFWADFGDVETAQEDLIVELYASLVDHEGDIEALFAQGEVAHEFEDGDVSSDGYGLSDTIFYQPSLGDGRYYFYLVVTDLDGNSVMKYFGEDDYAAAGDNLAPVPGDGGAFAATFNGGNVNQVNIQYGTATDDLTDYALLEYAFVIFDGEFDVSTWDYDFNHPSVLFSYVFVGQVVNIFDTSAVGLQYNTYYQAALFVADEGDLVSVYQIVDLVSLD